MSTQFLSGSAKVDITPRPGVGLGGYPHTERKNTGAHDQLYATSLYMSADNHQVLLMSLDLVKVSKQDIQKWRGQISSATSITTENIIICCTHSHSAPWSSKRADSDFPGEIIKPDTTYMEKLEAAIITSATQAVDTATESEFGYASGICGKEQGIGGNRRDKENGICDPEVNVIAVKNDKNSIRTVVVKYAVHPTILHGDNTKVSADYPAYIRSYLSGCYPDANILFLQGTAGNQSPRYFRSAQTFEETERFGTTLGKSAEAIIKAMTFQQDVKLDYASKEIDIELKQLPPIDEAQKQVDKFKKVWQAKKESDCSYTETWNAQLNLFGAEHTYNWALLEANGELPQILNSELPAEIGVLSINQVRMVTMQGEIFVEFGLNIKSDSKFNDTFTVGLANGALSGYVCTQQAYDEGGYEAGTSMLTANAGQAMVETAMQLINQS